MSKPKFPDSCQNCGAVGKVYTEGDIALSLCRSCHHRYVAALAALTPEGKRLRRESRGRISSLHAETWAYRRGMAEKR